MNFIEYQHTASKFAKPLPLEMALAHASLGLATETGEFTTEVKRIAIYEKPLTEENKAHMLEELGDTLWYIALAAEALGYSLGWIATENIAKLYKRYPQGYTNAAAEARADKNGLSPRDS